jgi:hypothetical protein
VTQGSSSLHLPCMVLEVLERYRKIAQMLSLVYY